MKNHRSTVANATCGGATYRGSTRRSMRRHCLCIAGVLSVALSLLVAAPSAGGADDDLDQALLGDLESDLLKDLETKPKDGGAAKPQASDGADAQRQPPSENSLDARSENPLADILQRMRDVESLIAAADASQKTQKIQREVIDELDVLIQQLQKQCSQQQQKNSPGQKSGKPQGGKTAARKPSDKPAGDSEERLDSAQDKRVDALAPDQLIKEVWGHLPARVVEQMSRQSVEKFLPKYEQLIEDYFRRLAEEPTP